MARANGARLGEPERSLALPVAIALVLLSACNDPVADDPAPNPQAAESSPSVPLITSPPTTDADLTGLPKDYAELWQAAKALELPGFDGMRNGDGSGEAPSQRFFDVIDCAEAYRSVEPREIAPDQEGRERLARRVVMLERGLKDAGYGEAVTAAPLREYQMRMLAVIAGKAVPAEPTLPAYFYEWFGDEARSPAERPTRELVHLAQALDDQRQRVNPDLPPIEARGECGAGEQPFLIRSAPVGAKVWLATRFAYNLCTVRRIDGWDRDRCRRWSEMDPAVPAALSGTYMYQARWPDGRMARGNRTLDGLNTVGEDGVPVVVTIRPD
jgi:hypothetical protein